METKHKSYGNISVSRYTGTSEFFGSDLIHNGGISIEISGASVKRESSRKWIRTEESKIRVHMSHNQFVDMITSGMNTVGVPCTIVHEQGHKVDQIPHARNTRDDFKRDFQATNEELLKRIDELEAKMNGNIGKRKLDELKHDLKIIKSHLKGNIPFVMKSFTEEMENVVTEAKHSIANYTEHKIRTLGLEALKKDEQIKLSE